MKLHLLYSSNMLSISRFMVLCSPYRNKATSELKKELIFMIIYNLFQTLNFTHLCVFMSYDIKTKNSQIFFSFFLQPSYNSINNYVLCFLFLKCYAYLAPSGYCKTPRPWQSPFMNPPSQRDLSFNKRCPKPCF